MYQGQAINILEQFGLINGEIILTDDALIMPEIREVFSIKNIEDLNGLINEKIIFYTKQYNNKKTEEWVEQQIIETSNLIKETLLSGNINLNTLSTLEAITNPIRQFYDLDISNGLQGILLQKLEKDTNEILEAFNKKGVKENTIELTNYFVSQVKQALGVSS